MAPASSGGTIQNDILKEYVARGTYIYPPRPSMRLVTDTVRPTARGTCRSGTPISISGYHIREAGATAVQELAFTLANGIAYVQAGVDAGLAVDEFAPRLSFFFNAHNNFFEEVAKFRAARRMWAPDHDRALRGDGRAVEDAALPHPDRRLDPHRPAAREQHRARGHPGPGRGARRHAEPAHQRLRRGAGPAHRAAAQLALRTQQIIAHESGVADDRRPARRLLLRRGLTDAGRGRGPGATSTRSTAWAARSRPSRPGYLQRRDRPGGLRLRQGGRRRRAGRSSASTAYR